MKLLKWLAFLLALTAKNFDSTTSAVFNETTKDIGDLKEIIKDNVKYISNTYNVSNLASIGVNETNKENGNRVTNGYSAYAGQFPYQVFIYIQKYDRSSWCGASLIGSEWVLTAAHCTTDAYSVTVYLGSIVRYYGTSYTVTKENIIVHYAFDYNNLRDDISLIKIPAVNRNNPYIQPVKLPAISNYYYSYAGESVIVSGWGQTSDTNYAGSDYLQWARLQVIANDVCAAAYAMYGGPFYITSSKICIATTYGISTCYGDSGGPMVLENSRVLIGLTSFGYSKECESGNPAGFTRITSYLNWIKYYTGIYYT